jgi:predicted nucleic-acid-binding protein
MEDDPAQRSAAHQVVSEADLVAVPVPVICEFAWVLRSSYGVSLSDVARAVRGIITRSNVTVDHAAVQAGLAMTDNGGDFADGAIAAMGLAMGADQFVTFDRRAAAVLSGHGIPARLLGQSA